MRINSAFVWIRTSFLWLSFSVWKIPSLKEWLALSRQPIPIHDPIRTKVDLRCRFLVGSSPFPGFVGDADITVAFEEGIWIVKGGFILLGWVDTTALGLNDRSSLLIWCWTSKGEAHILCCYWTTLSFQSFRLLWPLRERKVTFLHTQSNSFIIFKERFPWIIIPTVWSSKSQSYNSWSSNLRCQDTYWDCVPFPESEVHFSHRCFAITLAV